jgi:hypothetical protein
MMADPASLMGDNDMALAPPLLLPAAPAPAGTLLLPPGGEAGSVAVPFGAGAGVSTLGATPRVVDVVELLLPDGAVAFSADGAGVYLRKGKRCSHGKISPIALPTVHRITTCYMNVTASPTFARTSTWV